MFETERLIVRPWRPADAARAFDIYSKEAVTKWIGMEKPLDDPAQGEKIIARWADLAAKHDHRYGCWAAEIKETGVIAGTVLLVPLPDPADGRFPGAVEVGWHFHPDSWHRGFATEAARGALTLGRSYGLPEVFAIAWPGNDPSLAVMRRLGMSYLGRTDRWYAREAECHVLRF